MANNSQDMKTRMAMLQRQQMQQGIAPNLLPGVRIEDLLDISCNNCGSKNFYPASALKFGSRLMSRNGQPTLAQFPLGFACASCGQLNPFDAAKLQAGLEGANGQDGQKLKAKQEKEKENPAPDLGVSVSEEVKPKEHLN